MVNKIKNSEVSLTPIKPLKAVKKTPKVKTPRVKPEKVLKVSKRYNFSLKGVNIDKIDQKYGITSTAVSCDDTIPENTTKITDLEVIKKIPEVISFLDESKKIRKCTVSMIDFRSGSEFFRKANKPSYNCFWDKNALPENCSPIGCPIKYIASRATKSYISEISKERYSITEPITEKRRKELGKRGDKRISIEKKDYYETDGIFCSFNCCLAFIQDPENKHNPLYRHSETLLLKMYMDFNGENPTSIIPAPSWRTLICFGGTLTIEKYRESFNKIQYISHGMYSSGYLFEDKLKF